MKCIHGGKIDFYKLHSSRLFIKCKNTFSTFAAHSNDDGVSNKQSKEINESGNIFSTLESDIEVT